MNRFYWCLALGGIFTAQGCCNSESIGQALGQAFATALMPAMLESVFFESVPDSARTLAVAEIAPDQYKILMWENGPERREYWRRMAESSTGESCSTVVTGQASLNRAVNVWIDESLSQDRTVAVLCPSNEELRAALEMRAAFDARISVVPRELSPD